MHCMASGGASGGREGVRGGVVAPGSHLQGGGTLTRLSNFFFQLYTNYNYPSMQSTQMISCSFA